MNLTMVTIILIALACAGLVLAAGLTVPASAEGCDNDAEMRKLRVDKVRPRRRQFDDPFAVFAAFLDDLSWQDSLEHLVRLDPSAVPEGWRPEFWPYSRFSKA